MKETKSDTTTIQVKRYVIKQLRPQLDARGWHLSLFTERLINCWLSGSIDIFPEGGKMDIQNIKEIININE